MQADWNSRHYFRCPGLMLVAATILLTFLACAADAPAKGSGTAAKGTVLSSATVRFNRIAGAPDPNDIFSMVNSHRVSAGLAPLRPNAGLGEVATRRAQDMAGRNYYAHQDPDGLYYYDYLQGADFDKDNYSCENLDLQFTLLPAQYVKDWLDSKKGHRECMLADQATDGGYAAVPAPQLSGRQTAYIVVAIHAQSE